MGYNRAKLLWVLLLNVQHVEIRVMTLVLVGVKNAWRFSAIVARIGNLIIFHFHSKLHTARVVVVLK